MYSITAAVGHTLNRCKKLEAALEWSAKRIRELEGEVCM